MAIEIEKPLKDFLAKFKKDLNKLQKDLKEQSDELVNKVKTAADKDHLKARRKELEALVEKNLRKYEPSINKFVHEVSTQAKKAGVDLTQLEKKVKDNLKTARGRLTKAGEKVKARAKKTTAAARGRKPGRPKATKPADTGSTESAE